MTNRAAQSLLAFALAAFAVHACAEKISAARSCGAGQDSKPSSLGADGWAAVDGPVTGGCGAVPARVFDVHTRSQLVDALTKGHFKGKEKKLDHHSKIIYVHGTIDLNVDDVNVPLNEEDYMRMCAYIAHATYYGSGGFFDAYKAAYDPNLWIKHSLDPADNRPPALTGPLEEARLCFQRKQAERVMIDVGSNTSIIGVGPDARIKNGGLRIGYMNQNDANDPENYRAENVVVRNITFSDAFDMFPSWDPKDSFSITLTASPGCQATYDAATDSGPHRCFNPNGTPAFRGGRWNTEYDSIQIMNASGVWIDHNSFSDEPRFDTQFPPVFAAPFNEPTQKVAHHDGHVDVTLLGTQVTISNNHFMRHDKGHLLGGSDVAGLVPGYGPGVIDVTFHGNYYQNMIQRMPRVRFGRVHVYNNVFDVNRLANAEYRLGDSWATGTAAKLVTENNLFDILNNNLTIPRIINYASTVANREICVEAGFSLAECGTYYVDKGTWITMRTATTSATSLLPAFTLLKAIQESSSSNAPLMNAAAFWLPSYDYSLAPVTTPEDRAALRAQVLGNAGAGKL